MLFSKEHDDRFKVIYKQGMMTGFRIIQDRETGVNYLLAFEGNVGGLTVLLDENGKPVVTPLDDDY
ncbi:MAG: glycoside hydrolase family 68 protein [Clostridiales bacterium]|nr:glycoside hydrolase family 68 protein [Clostridiales bacterium]